jgi:hypothetical protein
MPHVPQHSKQGLQKESSLLPKRSKYKGRKVTESLGNVTVRGEKDGKSKRGARLSTVSLSMYIITENIYYSQLSSVEILLQPEPNCSTSYYTRKGLCSLSTCAIILRSPPASHVFTSNGQRSSQLFCAHYNSMPPRKAEFAPGSVHVGLVMDKVALG